MMGKWWHKMVPQNSLKCVPSDVTTCPSYDHHGIDTNTQVVFLSILLSTSARYIVIVASERYAKAPMQWVTQNGVDFGTHEK